MAADLTPTSRFAPSQLSELDLSCRLQADGAVAVSVSGSSTGFALFQAGRGTLYYLCDWFPVEAGASDGGLVTCLSSAVSQPKQIVSQL